jgi:hypothetical protein
VTMLPLPQTGLTTPAVAGRGLSEGLGLTGSSARMLSLWLPSDRLDQGICLVR